ncbi:MAG TPA: flippase activity-associated protein Agl23 [Solirubrobacteraceae bacterium]|nr:flippase activity-associated protein Agl23 [Solirubrobacteraceae bacterium]
MTRLKTWIADRPRGELYAHLAVVALALGLRLYDLGARPFHHDESQDAYFSWVFAERGDYSYNPLLHGPLRFYLTALAYVVLGDSDFTARLAPALMGTVVVALPYLMRRQIGRPAAFVAALLFAIGPTFLYFSRFAREDIYVAALNLGLIIAIFRFLDRPRAGGPAIIGVLLALAFATKESTFITSGLLTIFFAGALAVQVLLARSRGTGWRDAPLVRSVSAVGWVPWAYGFAAFWVTFALMFTVFLTDLPGLRAGLIDGLKYWHEQQGVGRGGEPWYFHIAVLFGEEWPVLLLAALGTVAVLDRLTLLHAFLVYFSFASLVVYSIAAEKFAWLAMHPLMPMILLAGVGAQAVLRAPTKAARALGAVVLAACLAYTSYASFLVNAKHPVDPREWLVSTQSSQDVKEVADEVLALDRRARARGGRGVTVTVDSGQGATFPYAWYFRHLGVGYIDMTTPGYVPETQVLVMTEQARSALLPELAAYDGRRFRFRVWWVRDWDRKFDPEAWLDWFVHRRTWNPTGGMPEWLYVRRDLAGG